MQYVFEVLRHTRHQCIVGPIERNVRHSKRIQRQTFRQWKPRNTHTFLRRKTKMRLIVYTWTWWPLKLEYLFTAGAGVGGHILYCVSKNTATLKRYSWHYKDQYFVTRRVERRKLLRDMFRVLLHRPITKSQTIPRCNYQWIATVVNKELRLSLTAQCRVCLAAAGLAVTRWSWTSGPVST